MQKTIGLEEEFLLVNDDLQQGHIPAQMLKEMMAKDSGVSPEVFDSHLEVQTTPCATFTDLKEDILNGRRRAQKLAQKYGLNICSAGTLGCYKWQEVEPLPIPAIQEVVADFGEAFRSQSIAALHMHVKADSLAKSLEVVNRLSWYCWLFLALSGSSRYYDQRDTGVSSRRVPLIGQTERTGLPGYYSSPADYEGEQEALKLAGWAPNKLWYYVRHNPNHNTVEMRIADAVPLVEDVLALGALFLCLSHAATEADGRELFPDMSLTVNRLLAQTNIERAMCFGTRPFSASGSNVAFIQPNHKELSLWLVVRKLIEALLPVAVKLGCEEHLQNVRNILQRGNSSARQHKAVVDAGDISAATRLVKEETLRDL